jgi:hypothetical protein
VFVHQRQLIYTPGILLANNGPLSVGDKEALIKCALFFIRVCTIVKSTKMECVLMGYMYECRDVERG